MTGPDGTATPVDQDRAITGAMEHVADLIAAGVDVVLTHGNGPQVGNLLVKNELAAAVVPPVPLDWCGAQTQATIGFLVLDALDRSLAVRGVDRRGAPPINPPPPGPGDPRVPPPPKPAGPPPPRQGEQPLVRHR